MSPIPDFIDNYHLPAGEHECTFDEIEQKFVNNSQRQKVWADFKRLYDRFSSLGLTPKSLIVDGSFVTRRELPGDVDFGALILPSVVKKALDDMNDSHDKAAIKMFSDPSCQKLIRDLFGAHMLVVPNEFGLRQISKLFRTGGDQFGKLRDRDPNRDPDWVTIPQEKGILRMNLY